MEWWIQGKTSEIKFVWHLINGGFLGDETWCLGISENSKKSFEKLWITPERIPGKCLSNVDSSKSPKIQKKSQHNNLFNLFSPNSSTQFFLHYFANTPKKRCKTHARTRQANKKNFSLWPRSWFFAKKFIFFFLRWVSFRFDDRILRVGLSIWEDLWVEN